MKTTQSKIYETRVREIYIKWYKHFYGEDGLEQSVSNFIENGYDDKFQVQPEDDTFAGDLTGQEVKTRENSGNDPNNAMLDYFKYNRKRYFLVAQL